MEDLACIIENKDPIDIIYLDFRKAFDSVPHERLLTKLKTYGITRNVLEWIRMFLSGRTQRVKVGSDMSNKKDVLSGIPQGSILGPILFTLFINDLQDIVSSNCKVFADDTKIYNIPNNRRDSERFAQTSAVVKHLGSYILIQKSVKYYVLGINNPCNVYSMLKNSNQVPIATCKT